MPDKKRQGRPPFEITDKVCRKAEEYAAQGLTAEQIAMVLGIGASTLYEKQIDFPEFAEAIKRGRGQGIVSVTNALYQKATVDKDNTAMIFYLKNRAGWVDKQETTTTVEQRHIIDLSRITDEQLTQLESVFEQAVIAPNQSRENATIIEGVHQELLAND
tara:strand:- start:646 stop:1125 length:480 start_codon:yes stop_codon:yes gene_type:complete